MITRKDLYVSLTVLCTVIIAFAVIMAVAISSLRSKVSSDVRDLTKEITEHRKEDRDRYYESKQNIALDFNRTRETVKDYCEDHITLRRREGE